MDHQHRSSLGMSSHGVEILSPSEIRPGDILHGIFEVINLIGQGSSASVFKCRHLALGNLLVAVKIFKEQAITNPLAIQRLGREIMAAHVVNHPNVARFYDCIREGTFITIVSEFIDGGTLEHYIKKSPPSLEQSMTILSQVAAGLQAIHKAGIIHRDLKPLNILVGKDKMARITDFGIVSLRDNQSKLGEIMKAGDGGDVFATQKGRIVGTPYYLSPEYLEHNNVDERIDIYAFGVIAYELVTRRLPFESENLFDLIKIKLHEDPRPPHLVSRECPPELSSVIMRAMHRDPHKRIQTASELLSHMQHYLSGVRFSSTYDASELEYGDEDESISREPGIGIGGHISALWSRLIHTWDGVAIIIALVLLMLASIFLENPGVAVTEVFSKTWDSLRGK